MRNILNKILKGHKSKEAVTESPLELGVQQSTFKITLLSTSEGRIFIVGILISLAYTIWLGSNFLFNPEKAQLLASITAFAILFGRAAGLAMGYTLQFGHRTVIPICMIIETIMVLVFYPLFVFSWRHLLVIKKLKRFFDSIHKTAITHQDKVRKYGIIGLFVFVWFPFWMTGPMVGCVIGFLMALPAWLNLSVVLGGTYLAILCWAFVLHHFHARVAQDSPFAAMILMFIIVIIVVIGVLLSKVRKDTKSKGAK